MNKKNAKIQNQTHSLQIVTFSYILFPNFFQFLQFHPSQKRMSPTHFKAEIANIPGMTSQIHHKPSVTTLSTPFSVEIERIPLLVPASALAQGRQPFR